MIIRRIGAEILVEEHHVPCDERFFLLVATGASQFLPNRVPHADRAATGGAPQSGAGMRRAPVEDELGGRGDSRLFLRENVDLITHAMVKAW
jgi:hypothetical protein